MHFSLQALSELVGGTVRGEGKVQITGARSIAEAGPGDITFAEDDRYAKLLGQSRAAAAVVKPGFEADGLPLICVANPLEAFVRIAEHLQGSKRLSGQGVHPQACIAPSARLGAETSVGPFVVIGEDVTISDRCHLMAGTFIGDGCRLGSDVVLHPHVVLYPGTILGQRVIIHAGAIVGADGFGYRFQRDSHVKMPQLGHVELGDDVEIGANTTIDRSTFDVTRIGAGTKIDNLVQVAHNCQIGRHNLLISQAGIAGSSKTGDYVVIAGQAGIRDHLTIGNGAVIGAMAGVMRDVADGERVVGVPATPERDQVRIVAALHRLPELRGKFNKLAKQVEEIKQNLDPKTRAA